MEKLKTEKRGYERSVLIKRGRRVIAEVFPDEPGDQYEKSDVFASSEDMLFALKQILEFSEDKSMTHEQARQKMARSACDALSKINN